MDFSLLIFFNQTIAHPIFDVLALILTLVGFAMLPGLGVALLIGRRRKVGLTILVALGTAFIAVLIFQYLSLRPRPENIRQIQATPRFPAYPSGHAAAAFSTAFVLGLCSQQIRIWLAALIGAGLIAFSRVYLGHHYPSDLLGGSVLGASIGAACYGLIAGRRPGQPGWQWLLWPQIAVAFIVSQMAYLDILPTHLLQWPLADKVLHFLLAGLIAFWLNLWLNGRTVPVKNWSIPLALLILFTAAFLEESSQYFSPIRTLSMADLFSNLLGIFVFWWISQQVLKRQQAKHPLNSDDHKLSASHLQPLK